MSSSDDVDDFLQELNQLSVKYDASPSPFVTKTNAKYGVDYDEKIKKLENEEKENKRKDEGVQVSQVEGVEEKPLRNHRELREAIAESKASAKTNAVGGTFVPLQRILDILELPEGEEDDSFITELDKRRMKFLENRNLLQTKQLVRIQKMKTKNNKELEALKEESRVAYKTNLEDADQRDKLPDRVKARLFGSYVNRIDLKTRLKRMERNLITSINQYSVWKERYENNPRWNILRYKTNAENVTSTKKNETSRKLEEAKTNLKNKLDKLKKQQDESEITKPAGDQPYVSISDIGDNRKSLFEVYPYKNTTLKLREAEIEVERAYSEKRDAEEEYNFYDAELKRVITESETDNLISYNDYFDRITDDYIKQLIILVGLYEAKSQIASDIMTVLTNPLRFGEQHFNISLLGHAGTGKTKLASIISPLYKLVGIIPNGDEELETFHSVSPNDMQSSYQAETAVLTEGMLMSYALGGALFIDEAYGFGQSGTSEDVTSGGSSGAQAITQMVKTLDDFKGLMLVIVAGYEHTMENLFFAMNAGLRSRFPRRIVLPDYNAAELYEIFMDKANPGKAKKYNILGKELVEEMKQSSRTYGMTDEAREKIRATFVAMKEFDEQEVDIGIEARADRERFYNNIRDHIKKIRDDMDKKDDEMCTKTEELAALVSIDEQINSKDHRLRENYDPNGFFRESNARGAEQFFNECVNALSARESEHFARINSLFKEEEVQFTVEDIKAATYLFSRQSLGISLDFVDLAAPRSADESTVEEVLQQKRKQEEEEVELERPGKRPRRQTTFFSNQNLLRFATTLNALFESVATTKTT